MVSEQIADAGLRTQLSPFKPDAKQLHKNIKQFHSSH